jgi:TonB family protein
MEKEIAKHARVKGAVRSWMVLAVCAFIIASTFPKLGVTEEPIRKLLSAPPPVYPELARKLNIKGIARVRITIAKDGKIREVKELGGNPVLVSALVDAVKKWKYEAAPEESVTEIKFQFQ